MPRRLATPFSPKYSSSDEEAAGGFCGVLSVGKLLWLHRLGGDLLQEGDDLFRLGTKFDFQFDGHWLTVAFRERANRFDIPETDHGDDIPGLSRFPDTSPLPRSTLFPDPRFRVQEPTILR